MKGPMTDEQVGVILEEAAKADPRFPAPDVYLIDKWRQLLTGLDLDDCVDAVNAHYRAHTDMIMPAHVVERARIAEQRRHARTDEEVRHAHCREARANAARPEEIRRIRQQALRDRISVG